jgi:hypothetical protein
MSTLSIDAFRDAIRKSYGSECQLVGRERVHEIVVGSKVWEGEVLIFDLLGSDMAMRCYGWETNGEVTAVLHSGPIDSPVKAVRASILAAQTSPSLE